MTRTDAAPSPAPSPIPREVERSGLFSDGLIRAALVLGLALQFVSLGLSDGYQLADSVEYMDRADELASGHGLDPEAVEVRSFVFSALLVPIFAAARWLAVDDMRLAVGACRAMQMAIALVAAAVAARTARRAFGRTGAIAAALLIASNPVALRYSVEPLADSAALLFLALGLDALVAGGNARRGLGAGACLGASILMAFKCVPIAGAMCLVAWLRDWRRARPFALGVAGGLALLLLVQSVVDFAAYGNISSSLASYVVSAVGYNVADLLLRLGFREAGAAIYNAIQGAAAVDPEYQATGTLRGLKSVTYYFENTPREFLAWPMLALVLLGLARAALRASWAQAICAVALLLDVAITSRKGSKSFRLWMPLLPLCAFLAAGGLAWIARDGAGRARRMLAAVWLLAGVALGVRLLAAQNLRKYGGYWEAMEVVNAAAREAGRGPDDPLLVASAYHWATRFREVPGVRLEKLPEHLDRWKELPPERREAVLADLERYDWLIGHGQAFLEERPELLEVVNRRYEIADVLYDRTSFEEMKPIYVLRARTGLADARTFYDVLEGADAGAYQAALRSPRSVDFRRRAADGSVRQLVLLGWELTPLRGAGDLAWITYHWYAGATHGSDYRVVDRFTDPQDRAFQNDHAFCHGALPTSRWREGWIVRDSYLLVVPAGAARFGGDWCRGDVVPLRLWLALPEHAADGQVLGGLSPFRASGLAPAAKDRRPEGAFPREGWRWSQDNLALVGGCFLPVPQRSRIPDDGRPLPSAGDP